MILTLPEYTYLRTICSRSDLSRENNPNLDWQHVDLLFTPDKFQNHFEWRWLDKEWFIVRGGFTRGGFYAGRGLSDDDAALKIDGTVPHPEKPGQTYVQFTMIWMVPSQLSKLWDAAYALGKSQAQKNIRDALGCK